MSIMSHRRWRDEYESDWNDLAAGGRSPYPPWSNRDIVTIDIYQVALEYMRGEPWWIHTDTVPSPVMVRQTLHGIPKRPSYIDLTAIIKSIVGASIFAKEQVRYEDDELRECWPDDCDIEFRKGKILLNWHNDILLKVCDPYHMQIEGFFEAQYPLLGIADDMSKEYIKHYVNACDPTRHYSYRILGYPEPWE